jgi:hypothetical protein
MALAGYMLVLFSSLNIYHFLVKNKLKSHKYLRTEKIYIKRIYN